MGNTFLFLHCAQCTILYCPRICQPYHRSSSRLTDGTRRDGRLVAIASTKEREWHKDTVQHKDLAGALEVSDFLNCFESVAGSLAPPELVASTSTPSSLKDAYMARSSTELPHTLDDLRILDACQVAQDLVQVGMAYDLLVCNGFLPNFGKDKSSASKEDRLVTDDILMESIGLNASKVSPKKWGLSGMSAITFPIGIALFSYIRDSGVDVRPIAALILAVGFYDAIYLGGTGLLKIFSMWLPYKRRVLVHEAGHVLVAYLLGCPIRGVILDPVQAVKMGIQGQAGTQFWDQTLEMQFSQVGLPILSVDRYSIVLFSGMAAEALIYGEAQGGESDENLYKAVVAKLQPSWSPAKMSDQARWAVLQAFQLLKKHKKAHAAVVRALEQEAGLGFMIKALEDAMP
ncbi:unnamed protein product [Calypogeia fissa]